MVLSHRDHVLLHELQPHGAGIAIAVQGGQAAVRVVRGQGRALAVVLTVVGVKGLLGAVTMGANTTGAPHGILQFLKKFYMFAMTDTVVPYKCLEKK